MRSSWEIMPTRLTCRAEHPANRRGRLPRFEGRVHGVFLQEVPYDARPSGRILADFAEVRRGPFVGVRCGGCKLITEYEITSHPKGATA